MHGPGTIALHRASPSVAARGAGTAGLYKRRHMNKNLWLLAAAQGLFLTNNVVFIAINGLVGLALAPLGWMATLPVMGYVVGGALATPLVARTQSAFGRQASFQIGLLVALASALLCAWAVLDKNFWWPPPWSPVITAPTASSTASPPPS